MATVKVEVPESQMNEAVAKELKSLRSKVTKLERQNGELKYQVEHYKAKGLSYDSFREVVKVQFDLHGYEDCH